ncbi:MAG: nicotinate (nicotinamide) nucleotide adenylyltransferase [Deltaproteobacteria bacterium GWA2_38_16]|nr:MAG: nicotinate (nicotinamide) nucleotide adenylyltransferase [Deltaproteobacteria bacterium GWA2_38_16]OGQ03355.1 MAG: nicotinate (nicotinamide) nucleotide adenylyltransferase [Deltaproteobacteria bacterium RIFCSPHIGHO2_02_FULL_38_15]OGQ33503.1 MAG: nicotinate (nicotinamide) nucleotide adenylyltransferase [Deltaproteobacteria bacterium RIFCSPLOWO2_01_FULL_38_9]HBQ20626.1 nicotinate (nicotinamide) nucleotide adenylyltransferase [Deltaproteobacteria bacterium]
MKNWPDHKRIGLFGGTFDPIHNGHIKAASKIKEKFSLDHIYFVPAYISPYKTYLGTSSSLHRLEMVKKGIEGFPDFSISEFELNKKEVSYTIHTLKHYKNILPPGAELYFILGSDAFLGISQWKNVEEIFSNCHLLVVRRPGHPLHPLSKILESPLLLKEFSTLKEGEHYRHFTGHDIYIVKIPTVNISSSELRQKIAHHKPYTSFVPHSVAEYIKKYSLYHDDKEKN